jgi:uncharacterized membrane protein
MKKLADYFFKGLLVTTPLFITFMIAAWVFKFLYGYASPFVGEDSPIWMKAALTVLVLLAMLAVVTLMGFAASNIIGQRAIRWLERNLAKLPIFKMIYSSVKDITEAFGGEKKKFDRPVLVRTVPEGPEMLGFVTSDSLEFAGLADKVSVYLPLSYNFCGIMIIVPREQIRPLELDSKEAMTFIFSGGIVRGKRDS